MYLCFSTTKSHYLRYTVIIYTVPLLENSICVCCEHDLRKGTEIFAKLVFSFSIIVFNMMKLLVIVFIMKLIAQIDIFKYVRQKHEQSAVKIVSTLKQVKRRYAKVNEDIKFIKICKIVLLSFKDELKAFDDFKNKQQKCME